MRITVPNSNEKPKCRRWVAIGMPACVFSIICGACHRSTPPPAESPTPLAAAPEQQPSSPSAQGFEVIGDEDAAERWLFVEHTREGADGGWASGSFDRSRNKIEIHTKDVRQFLINLARVPVDWEKLVVLSIDGKNSELRRREQSQLHIYLDDYGQWNVLEP